MSENNEKINEVSLKCTNSSAIAAKLLPCNLMGDESFVKTNELEQLYPTPKEEDNENHEFLYLRGRKLVGSELKLSNQKAYLAEVENGNIQCELKIDTVYNFEREGNGQRRDAEQSSLLEYVELMRTVMD